MNSKMSDTLDDAAAGNDDDKMSDAIAPSPYLVHDDAPPYNQIYDRTLAVCLSVYDYIFDPYKELAQSRATDKKCFDVTTVCNGQNCSVHTLYLGASSIHTLKWGGFQTKYGHPAIDINEGLS